MQDLTPRCYNAEGLIAEADASGQVTRSYGYAPGSTASTGSAQAFSTNPLWLKAAAMGSQTQSYYYYQNDHLGTPMKLLNQSGVVVWSATYDAFGRATVDSTSTVTNNFRYPGQYYDAETGLHYNWMRYYDPNTGRYSTSDPIGLLGGVNMYTYVYGNTLMYVDSYGLCMSKKFIKIAAATVGGAVTGGMTTGPWGIAYGAAAGLISESVIQYNPILEGASAKSSAGLVAGYYGAGRGANARAKAIGAIAGAYGGLVQSQTNGDFANAAAGGLGGLVGGVAGELLVPPKRYAGNNGALLFNSLKGGFAGFVGGLVQDALEAGLAKFACKEGEFCAR